MRNSHNWNDPYWNGSEWVDQKSQVVVPPVETETETVVPLILIETAPKTVDAPSSNGEEKQP